jgi:hypothetical protein
MLDTTYQSLYLYVIYTLFIRYLYVIADFLFVSPSCPFLRTGQPGTWTQQAHVPLVLSHSKCGDCVLASGIKHHNMAFLYPVRTDFVSS